MLGASAAHDEIPAYTDGCTRILEAIWELMQLATGKKSGLGLLRGLVPKRMDKAFFGMHVAKATTLSSPQTPMHPELGYGSWRWWDAWTNWRHIEKEKGVFDWARVDQMMAIAEANGLEVLWCLGQAPDWATGGSNVVAGNPDASQYGDNYNSKMVVDIQDWRDYLTAVGTRYKGRIQYYEVWNEPNQVGFWSGTVAQMAQLVQEARAVFKAIDPNIQIVSPSPTGNSGPAYLDSLLSAGMNNAIDIAACHLYVHPQPPEDMFFLAQKFHDVLKKNGLHSIPLWNTETTWHQWYSNGSLHTNPSNDAVMEDDLASSYLFRMFACAWAAGVERCFFYGLDYAWSAIRLIDLAHPDTLTPTGKAFQRTTDWLTGSAIHNFVKSLLRDKKL